MITAEEARRISNSSARRSQLSRKDRRLLYSIEESIYRAALNGKVDLEIGSLPTAVIVALQDLDFKLCYIDGKKYISWSGCPTVSDLEAYDSDCAGY